MSSTGLKRTLAAIGGGTFFLAILLLALSTTAGPVNADPGVLYVHPTCDSAPSPCYTVIQDAVDAASPGDEVRIATGVYTGVHRRAGITQTVYISKDLTLRGGYAPNFTAWDPDLYTTTVDAQRLGRGMFISGPVSVTVEGLRVTGGDATGLGGFLYNVPSPGDEYDAGGGIAVLSATLHLRHSVIADNLASTGVRWAYGGGLFLDHAAGRIEDTRFLSNTASGGAYGEGAGMCLFRSRGVVIRKSTFLSNTASITDAWGLGALGGAFSLWASEGVTLSHNIFRANRAHCAACQGDGHGGGLAFWKGNAHLEGNLIADNVAAGNGQTGRGAGLLFHNTTAYLVGNTVADNRASEGGVALGGGLFITGTSAVTLVNNVLARNVASSTIELTGPARTSLLHNTLADNKGWALRGGATATATLTNTIVAGNEGGITGTGTISPAYTLFGSSDEPGITGTHPVFGDPAFVDPDHGDYHILSTSAAVDAGVDAGVTTDIDGDSRPLGFGYDIGADEFVPVPPSGVVVVGPTQGVVNAGYAFTATVAPVTTTTPLTTIWQATGQAPMTTTGGLTSSAIFTWTTAGRKAITVTASNAYGTVGVTHTVEIFVPPSGVVVAGPTQGVVNAGYAFTATVVPVTTTTPLTTTWQATGQAPMTTTGGLTSSAVFTWTTPGRKAITVTAANAYGAATATHTVTIEPYSIYLPLVLRNR